MEAQPLTGARIAPFGDAVGNSGFRSPMGSTGVQKSHWLTDFFGGTDTYNNSNELTAYPAYTWSYDNNGNTTSKTYTSSGTTSGSTNPFRYRNLIPGS